jgi:hypothetical protein
MGKRSTFERRLQDAYDTPPEAVAPLIPHLRYLDTFAEPCAGNGSLVRVLEEAGMSCQLAIDIAPRAIDIDPGDAMNDDDFDGHEAEYVITNPPWTREILHPMIVRFSDKLPTWLLFDADWLHTRQSAPYLPRLRKIVSVGRVKWIPGSKHVGKDNCCWYLFDKPQEGNQPVFYGRSV